MNREPITNKRQMYQLLRAGLLGNTSQTWMTPDEWRASGFQGPISLRSTIPRQPFIYGLDPEHTVRLWQTHNIICEYVSPNSVIFQGEVCRQLDGLTLCWTQEKDNLRMAMPMAKETKGVAALVLLRSFIDPPSLDDLMDLLDMYPDHVIEFTTFNCAVGWAGRQTVIWEVRHY